MPEISDVKPFFSVVIPVYRVEDYVEFTLKSVKAQTFSDFECIIMDDGSPDGSAEVCERFIQGDPRFHLHHKENGGVSSARNAGAKCAKGKFLAFLDGDDWWDPCFLEKMHALIQKYPDCRIYGSARICVYSSKLQKTDYLIPNAQRGEMLRFDALHQFAPQGEFQFGAGCTVIPQSVFEQSSQFSTQIKMCEDQMLDLEIVTSGLAGYLNEAHFYYRLNVPTAQKPRGVIPALEVHMLSVLDQFAEEAKKSPDLKLYLDRFRLKHLFFYVDHPIYRDAARKILANVAPESWTFRNKILYRCRAVRACYLFYRSLRKKIKNILAKNC